MSTSMRSFNVPLRVIQRFPALLTVALLAAAAAQSAAPADGAALAAHYRQAVELRQEAPDRFAGGSGLVVVAVEPESPAAALGIRLGDVWLRYQDRPITSQQAFLAQCAEPDDSGPLDLFRDGRPLRLQLPPGRLGAGIVEPAPLGLDAADLERFFRFLAASYAGDMDAAGQIIRRDHADFARIREQFAKAAGSDAPGAAQLKTWSAGLADILSADAAQQRLEARQKQLAKRHADIEQELAAVRAARAELKAHRDLIALAEAADQAMDAGDTAAAERHWQKVQQMAKVQGLAAADAVSTAALSRIAAERREVKRAQALADQAEARAAAVALDTAATAAPLRERLPAALLDLGELRLQAGNPELAVRTLEAARHYAEALADAEHEVEAWVNLSRALTAAKRVEEAVAAAKEAVAFKLPPAAPGSPLASLFAVRGQVQQAIAYTRLAEAHAAAGDYVEASRAVETALERIASLQEHSFDGVPLEQRALINELLDLAGHVERTAARLGELLRTTMTWEKPDLAYHEALLADAEETGDRRTQVSILLDLGDALERHGRELEAVARFKQASELAHALGDNLAVHKAALALANLYQALGDYEQAITHADQAAKSARRLPHRLDDAGLQRMPPAWYAEREVMALEVLGNAHLLGNGDLDAAKAAFTEAGELAAKFLTGTPREWHSDQMLGYMMALRGDDAAALPKLQGALDAMRQHESPQLRAQKAMMRGGLLTMIAEVAISAERFAEAADALNEAEALLATYDDPLLRNNVREARARAALLQGKAADAEGLLRQNLDVLEQMRRRLSADELAQLSFGDLYSSNAELLLWALIEQGKDKDAEALAVAETQRGRTLATGFAAGDSEASGAGPDLSAIAAEHGATLVVYSLLYDPRSHLLPGRFAGHQARDEARLLIWVVPPDGAPVLRQVDLAQFRHAHGRTLDDLVRPQRRSASDLARLVAEGEPDADPATAKLDTSLLHRVLIEPVANLLPAPGAPLVFVPQGALLFTPFGALAGSDGQILAERHPIASVPAARLLQVTGGKREPIGGSGVQGDDVLVVGNPHTAAGDTPPDTSAENLDPTRGLPALPGAEQEATKVAEIWDAPEPLLGPAATEDAVRARIGKARLLHFAAHGQLDDIARGGAPGSIVLAPGERHDGLLTAAEILELALDADLAVLSACDTGRGRLTGDGVVGLAYAFMQAGVPSLVVSLWPVPDGPTAVLMETFHRELRAGANKAEALRRAMLATRAAGYSNPYDWAGFTLIGQW